jgi:protease-4
MAAPHFRPGHQELPLAARVRNGKDGRMRLFRWIGRVLIGALAVIGAFVLALVVIAIFAWRELPSRIKPVPASAVLTLDLADGVVETRAGDPLALAGITHGITMPDLVLGLEAAGRDPRVKGLALKLGTGSLSLARAQEIRDAVAAFRTQGKFVLAFAESFGEAGDGNAHYDLATAADEIWMQPSGSLDLKGIRLESVFLKDMLDSIGVAVRMDRRKEYKGALDSLTAASMPAPQRENLQRLVGSMAESLADGVAARTGGDTAAARALIDRGPFLAPDALAAKLVDRLGYRDEFEAEVDRRGVGAARYALADYAAALEPAQGAATIALVHGLGPIQLGGGAGAFGDLIMDAETVAAALRHAREDPEVKAILFRIDSPGGSYVAADAIWREVARAEQEGKPVVVSMGDVAGSGGYFIAAPATTIVAEPSTITGSIGVFGGKLVLSRLWSKLGIGVDGVQSGANADIDSPNRDYSEAGWAYLQSTLDSVYRDFVTKVGAGRHLDAEAVERLAKGQVWTGADAAKSGLVDRLGGLSTAIEEARKAAGLAPGAPVKLVPYPPQPRDLASFLEQLAQAAQMREFATLASLSRLAVSLERLVAGGATAPQAEMAPFIPAMKPNPGR